MRRDSSVKQLTPNRDSLAIAAHHDRQSRAVAQLDQDPESGRAGCVARVRLLRAIGAPSRDWSRAGPQSSSILRCAWSLSRRWLWAPAVELGTEDNRGRQALPVWRTEERPGS